MEIELTGYAKDMASTQNSENELKENPMSIKYDMPDNREPELSELEDNINPKHYTDMVISPHEYNKVNDISWNEAQVIKYVSRWKAKNGLEDLLKSHWYLSDLIKDEATKLSESEKEKTYEKLREMFKG